MQIKTPAAKKMENSSHLHLAMKLLQKSHNILYEELTKLPENYNRLQLKTCTDMIKITQSQLKLYDYSLKIGDKNTEKHQNTG